MEELPTSTLIAIFAGVLASILAYFSGYGYAEGKMRQDCNEVFGRANISSSVRRARYRSMPPPAPPNETTTHGAGPESWHT